MLDKLIFWSCAHLFCRIQPTCTKYQSKKIHKQNGTILECTVFECFYIKKYYLREFQKSLKIMHIFSYVNKITVVYL